MGIAKIEVIADGLFAGIPYYLEYSTGHIMAYFIVPENNRTNAELYLQLPQFSIAHVEQIYLQKKYGNSDEYKAYGLHAYPKLPIELNEELRALAAKYSNKAHAFIMDRFDRKAEIEYDDFKDMFCVAFAKKWCKENGIAFEYMFKENE